MTGYAGIMATTSQQFGQKDPATGELVPMFNPDGTPYMNYVLYSFDRGFYDGAGKLQREEIRCKLSFFSQQEITEFVRSKRGGLPIPPPGSTKKAKDTKWSPDVTFDWKDFK